MKKITALFFVFLLGNTGAQAALVTFDLLGTTVGLNDIFTVDIVGQSFPDTEGGGINLSYDKMVVNVLSVSIDDSVWNFVSGNNPGTIDNVNGGVNDILVAALPAVNTGDFIVATVQFQAVGFGITNLTLTDSTINNPWGSGGSPINPGYAGDGTNNPGTINVQAIPIPAALWLFGSGLLGLIGISRCNTAF